MSEHPFGGLWTYPSSAFPPYDDFMLIDEQRRRIIVFAILKDNPLWRCPIRYWYQSHSTTSIAVRLKSSEPWKAHSFLLEGDQLSWTVGDATQAWRRVSWADRPEWLDELFAKAYAKMDAEEASTGSS